MSSTNFRPDDFAWEKDLLSFLMESRLIANRFKRLLTMGHWIWSRLNL